MMNQNYDQNYSYEPGGPAYDPYAAPANKDNRTRIILLVVIVLLALCCCCVIGIPLMYYVIGDMITDALGITRQLLSGWLV
jgi:biotin transporter BioY